MTTSWLPCSPAPQGWSLSLTLTGVSAEPLHANPRESLQRGISRLSRLRRWNGSAGKLGTVQPEPRTARIAVAGSMLQQTVQGHFLTSDLAVLEAESWLGEMKPLPALPGPRPAERGVRRNDFLSMHRTSFKINGLAPLIRWRSDVVMADSLATRSW